MRPGGLRDGHGGGYTFTLNVTLQPGRGGGDGWWGSASLSLLPNPPPHGGQCVLEPEEDILVGRPLETGVTYTCTGRMIIGVTVGPFLNSSPCGNYTLNSCIP